eukprot:CAMPEP_0184553250 /NCGR_PEP_ID=MMETSP0199_2-20130426/31394_1 /TAXON_ID=1112570 /ORGANISM="Thraustochytrium sp., Strain LLF1b" /LENGTH=124 /DNA_ID=CAMNT_0026948949 /DNA_START=363 /DNA_END=734 /DNA_ORIENTATION=+
MSVSQGCNQSNTQLASIIAKVEDHDKMAKKIHIMGVITTIVSVFPLLDHPWVLFFFSTLEVLILMPMGIKGIAKFHLKAHSIDSKDSQSSSPHKASTILPGSSSASGAPLAALKDPKIESSAIL